MEGGVFAQVKRLDELGEYPVPAVSGFLPKMGTQWASVGVF